MPFKSESQRRFMYAKHPRIAERWSKKEKASKDLPEKKKKKKSKKEAVWTVKNSQLHGLGLFSNKAVKPGQTIVKAAQRQGGQDGLDRYEITFATRYTNHADVPNARLKKVASGRIEIVATQPIEKGAEVLVDYKRTRSAFGPGSYMTYRGEVRATKEDLEKQAAGYLKFAQPQQQPQPQQPAAPQGQQQQQPGFVPGSIAAQALTEQSPAKDRALFTPDAIALADQKKNEGQGGPVQPAPPAQGAQKMSSSHITPGNPANGPTGPVFRAFEAVRHKLAANFHTPESWEREEDEQEAHAKSMGVDYKRTSLPPSHVVRGDKAVKEDKPPKRRRKGAPRTTTRTKVRRDGNKGKSTITTRSRPGKKMYKKSDKDQAVRDLLGSLQQAYVADAVGADASARAAAQAKDHPDVEDTIFNEWVASAAGGAEPFQRRIRHGASYLAESPKARMAARFDPSQLLTEDPDATLVSLLSGTGKKSPEREELVKQRYKAILKKYQDKLDPDVEKTERDTPWHRLQQGALANLDSDIAGHKYMRDKKPWQYWLNPLDKSGPIHEIVDRLTRRTHAGVARPESTLGRFGVTAGQLPTLGLLPLLMGGEEAQQKLRRSAAENKLYADVAEPEKKANLKEAAAATERGVLSPVLLQRAMEKQSDAWSDAINAVNEAMAGRGGSSAPSPTLGSRVDTAVDTLSDYWNRYVNTMKGGTFKDRIMNPRKAQSNQMLALTGTGLVGGGALGMLNELRKKEEDRDVLVGGLGGGLLGSMGGMGVGAYGTDRLAKQLGLATWKNRPDFW